ncbi:MAG: DUF2269 family protein [Deltaproteobacteria bacterium]|jgi:hypothetical protein|nr:DUF2269 family protein [Deltaproteobacteria bacterium]
MRKYGRTGQRALKTIHLVFASLWLGGAVALNAVILLTGPAGEGAELLGYCRAAIVVDDAVVIPGALGCLLTGILISGFTGWGFFRHRWVTVKYVLTVVCICVGTFLLGPTVNGQPAIASELGAAAQADPAYRANHARSLLGGAFQLAAILFMTSLSTFKPWQGRDRAGRPAGAPEIPAAPPGVPR